MVGAHKVIGRGLGCGIGAVRTVRRLLGEISVRAETAIDLIGADVMEKIEFTGRGSYPGRLEKIKCPVNIGLDERLRFFYRAIDMRLGGKVTDRIDFKA